MTALDRLFEKMLTNAYKRRIIIYGKGRIKMKRADLIKMLKRNGWYFIRNGGNHDIYGNGKRMESIERHKEIPEPLAKAIIKRNGLK